MDARIRELEAENARLRAENERQRARIDRLMARIDNLEAALEEARREAKRQAAPFRKSEGPAPDPKKPGRKSGRRHGPHAHRAIPPKIDERYDAPLPKQCPHCHGRRLSEIGMATQYQTEIPRRPIYREFTIHVGQCRDCGHHVQGRHALQTSDAVGAAASQLGSEAHGALVLLNKELGLSHGKCAKLFQSLFGIRIARATGVRSLLRTARRAEPAYQQVRQDISGSPWVVPDETGWRVGGKSAWLHVFVGPRATCYDLGDRSGDIAERLLGADYAGTLIHDGWSVYDGFPRAFHQQCIGHLQRRCEELLRTAIRRAVSLPRQVLALVEEAFHVRRLWRGHRIDGDERTTAGLELACRLQDLVEGRFTHEPNRRLAKHILKHGMHWFWFLIDPAIDATNYRAEQAIRPAVVNRKVWGGNRTWIGARAQRVLTSLLVTLGQRERDALSWFAALLRRRAPLALPA